MYKPAKAMQGSRSGGKTVKLPVAAWEFLRAHHQPGDTLPGLLRRLLRLPPPPPPEDKLSRGKNGRWLRGVGRWPQVLFFRTTLRPCSAHIPRDVWVFVQGRAYPGEPFGIALVRLASRPNRRLSRNTPEKGAPSPDLTRLGA